jgi:hypothetical protein
LTEQTTSTGPAIGLYPRLLGGQWHALPEVLRRAHTPGGVRLQGTFRIKRPPRRFAGLIGKFLRLPAAAESAPVLLEIIPEGELEIWRRSINGATLNTHQWCDASGLLVERVSGIRLRFRVQRAGDAITYEQVGGARFLFPWLPLPGFLSPRITATETAISPRQVEVKVRVMFLGALLIAYTGHMEI